MAMTKMGENKKKILIKNRLIRGVKMKLVWINYMQQGSAEH